MSLAVAALAFKGSGDYSNLKLGANAPMQDYTMKDVSGDAVSLESAKGKKGLLVIFSCNTCPFVVGNGEKSEGWENRYNGVIDAANKAGIGSIIVNSNSAKREKGDSYQDMIKHAETNKYKGLYALDEKNALADAFGAKTTPHIFLFNDEMKLIYQGAIDDNVDSKKDVKVNYLSDAINAYSNGEEISVQETKPIGCSIKRFKADN